MENLLSASPDLGLISLIFLFLLSCSVIISVKYILHLTSEIKTLKEKPERQKLAPKKEKGDITVKSKDIKSISFKDDVA